MGNLIREASSRIYLAIFMTRTDHPRRNRLMQMAGWAVLLTSSFVFIAWVSEVKILLSAFNGFPALKFNACISFLLLAIVFIRFDGTINRINFICLAIVFVIAGLTVAEYVWSTSLGIDQLFFADHQGVLSEFTYPGRMSVFTAFSLVAMAVAMFLITLPQHLNRLAGQYILHGVTLLSFVSFTSFLFQVYVDPAERLLNIMSFLASFNFLLLSITASSANPTLGVASVYMGNQIGAFAARRIFPVTMFLTFVLGYVRLELHRHQLVEVEFGIVLFMISLMLVNVVVLSYAVRQLNRADEQRTLYQRRLVEEQALLRAIIDHLPLNVYVKDLQSRKTLANKAEYEFLGAEHEWEVLGKDDLAFYPPSSAQNSFDEDREVIRTGRPILNRETLNTRHNNRETWFSISKIPLKNTENETIGLLGISYDITSQKEAEASLRESAERYHHTLDNMMEGCQIIGYDWRYVYVNPSAARQGLALPGDLIGFTMMEKYPGIENLPLFSIMKKCMANRETASFENEFPLPNGELGWFELRIQPAPEGIFILSVDVTARKKAEIERIKSEKLFYTAFNMSPAPLMITRKGDGKILNVNEAFCQMAERTPSEMIGHTTNELGFWIKPDNREDVVGIVNQNGRVRNLEALIKFSPNKISQVLTSVEPIQLDNEECLITFALDITEQKVAEQALKESEEVFSKAFSSSPIAIMLTSLEDNRIHNINNTFVRELGYTRSETIGRNGAEIGLVSESQRRLLYHQLENEGLHNVELLVKAKNGSSYYYLLSVVEVVMNGHPYVLGSLVNIHERKVAENELRRSNERFELIAKTSNDALFELEIATGKAWMSESHMTLFGFDPTKEPPAREEWLQRIHPEDRHWMMEVDENIRKKDFVSAINELRFRKDNHSQHYGWLLQRYFVTRDSNGQPERLLGSFMEITSKKESEQELRLKETAIASALSGMGMADLQGRLIYGNEALARMWGYPNTDSLLGKSLTEVFHGERIHQTIHALQTVGYENGEDIGLRADGTRFDVAFTANIVTDYKGAPLCMFGSFIDITERKKAEARVKGLLDELAGMIEYANAAIFGIDQLGNINEWNKVTEIITGYQREEVIGQHLLRNFISEESRLTASEKFLSVMAGTPHSNLEIPLRTKSGETRTLLLSATPRKNANEEVVGLLIVGQDISELIGYRTNLEDLVEKRTAELQLALVKEKEMIEHQRRFISIASHEFRTPLSTISLATGFVRKYFQRLDQAELDTKLARIEKQVVHMTHLLDDVLTVGRAEEGKLQMTPKPIQVESLQDIAQEAVRSRGTQHQLKLHMQFDRSVMVADIKFLRTILVNLIVNAVKFSPDGRPVEVDLVLTGKQFSLRVKDYGIGIPPEDLPKMFTTFYRGSNVSATEGTGLGLSIVKKIIDRMEGTVHVSSALGEGTEFKVEIPVS